MMEGGSLVPMIANWPGTTPAGKVSADLIDFSDFYPTFASLAGAKLPEGVTIDGHSFAPQLLGQPGEPRDRAYVQLARMWYVRNAGWKLNEKGELYDLSDAPFVETLVTADTTDPAAVAAAAQTQAQGQHHREQQQPHDHSHGGAHRCRAPSNSSSRAAAPIRLIITAVAAAIEGSWV